MRLRVWEKMTLFCARLARQKPFSRLLLRLGCEPLLNLDSGQPLTLRSFIGFCGSADCLFGSFMRMCGFEPHFLQVGFQETLQFARRDQHPPGATFRSLLQR